MAVLPELKKGTTGTEYRDQLSTWISLISVGGVIALTIIMILVSWAGNDKETMKMVFTAALPLFGAWVGTILAFYYGRENFEAASRSIIRIAETAGAERLKEIPVTMKMIARKDMIVEDRPVDSIKLTEILNKLSEKERLPILNDKGAIIYMIHRSAIDRYLTQKALQSATSDTLKELTLNALLKENSEFKAIFENSFGIVKENATLADVKIEMERIPKCQDVFITSTGNKADPVIGWITNNIIQEIARV
jgi:hypothetical protein